jgi:hypothetical protein
LVWRMLVWGCGKCALSDKLMLLGFVIILKKKERQTAQLRNKDTLTL